jgi:hypothetical protein
VNRKKIRLDVKNNHPFNIKINAEESEIHSLIRLTKGTYCESLTILMLENGLSAPKNLPAKELTLLQFHNQTEFSVNANFSSVKGFLDLEIYTGKWEEVILAQLEFSFSNAPYNISCNQEHIEFTVGSEGECRIEVQAHDGGGFDVVYTLVKTPEQQHVVNLFFAESEDCSQIIRRLYGRIKGRVKGEGFEQRQAEYKTENIKNLNTIMLDSFVEPS